MIITSPGAPSGEPSGGARVAMYGESRDASMFTQVGTQIIQPPLPAALAVRYSLPPDTAAFTGRDEELRLITAAVTDAAGAGGVVAIHAMPGVGKTALAVHLLLHVPRSTSSESSRAGRSNFAF